MKYILMISGMLNGMRLTGTKVIDVEPSQLSDLEAIDKGRELVSSISWVEWAGIDLFEEGKKVRTIVLKASA